MQTNPTVVFTCCGGAGGWSLLRSLAQTGRYRLVGCDTEALVAALYQPELAGRYVVPSGHDPAYVDRVLEICKAETADVFWPGADEEVIACSAAAKCFAAAGVHLVASPHATVMTATDKLATVTLVSGLGRPRAAFLALGRKSRRPAHAGNCASDPCTQWPRCCFL